MTIYEAFRNRGLLAPERFRPIYRITYGSRYEKNTVTLQVGDRVTAKEQLQALWQQYAAEKHIPEDSVLDIHCVGNGDSTTV